jgi:hypothetical protein
MPLPLVVGVVVLGVASVTLAEAEAAGQCVRTGSSPKCEGDCCGTFPCVP